MTFRWIRTSGRKTVAERYIIDAQSLWVEYRALQHVLDIEVVLSGRDGYRYDKSERTRNVAGKSGRVELTRRQLPRLEIGDSR